MVGSGVSIKRRVTRATLASQLEDAIRLEIIEGILPPGQRLRANELTQRYGVSATPLREALQRLAAENLVEIDPRLGAAVTEISRTDLRDIYRLRDMLEGLALERSIQRADAEWEARLRSAWERFRAQTSIEQGGSTRDVLAWSEAHRAFHEALFDACDSAWLLRFVGTLYDHSERYRMLSFRSRRRDTLEEHSAIFRYAIERHAPEAVTWLRRHLANTVDNLEFGMSIAVDGSAPGAAAVG